MYKQVIVINNDIYVLAGGKTHHTKNLKEIEFMGYAKIS
jgi:hypothetical protein